MTRVTSRHHAPDVGGSDRPAAPRSGMWARVAAAAAVATAAGLLGAWLMPRGAITTGLALLAMMIGTVTGAVSGAVMRSRWAMLLAPAVFVAAFEVGRAPTQGPLVDAPRFGGMVETAAFVLGRGWTGLLVLTPMVLAAAYGAAWARRRDRVVPTRPGPGVVGRRVVAAGLAMGLVALAILIAVPARTAPILDADSQPLAGSVAELTTVDVGGHEQAVMIRGADTDAPVLLWLAGGPGGTDMGSMRLDAEAWEQDFVVATWDMRGAGKSYGELDPVDTLTLDQLIADTADVTRGLLERFDKQRLYLAGNSWGTLLGVLTVQRHPELYHAYIGAGQMVSPTETDTMFRDDTVAWAREQGEDALAEQVLAFGDPPYDDLLANAIIAPYEHEWNRYPSQGSSAEMPMNLLVPEYSFTEKVQGLAAAMDTFAVVYPQLADLDLRQDAAALDVPVYLVQGAHEARGRAVPAADWFDMLEAPAKTMVVFDESGHRPMFEQPEQFHTLLVDTVLAETGGS